MMVGTIDAKASLRGKKLLILDGSQKAIELVREARRLGLHVVVSDYNSPEDSPAKLVADNAFGVSTADVDGIASLIRSERIDGVIPGFSDRWLPTYGAICEAAAVPCYATSEILTLFTNKDKYKPLLRHFGVPTVPDYSVEDALRGRIPSHAYPLIVKPGDGSGSKGITICRSAEELNQGLARAAEYSWTAQTIIERYMPGDEATVYWVFQDGRFYVTMVANRHLRTLPDGRSRLPVGYSAPSHLVPHYLKDIAPRVQRMLDSVGVRNGIMFMQGLVTDGVFLTYDIGFRFTPTQEYIFLEHTSGLNPISLLMCLAVTGRMGFESIEGRIDPTPDQYWFNVSTSIMPGIVGSFHGLERVRRMPGVLSVSTSLREGDEVPASSYGQLSQVVVRTTGKATTPAQLRARIGEVVDTIDVTDKLGRSLTLPGISPGDLDGDLHVLERDGE